MIPGPVEVAPEVLDLMASPITPHKGDEWTAFYKETASLLARIVGTAGHVIILVGSGSAALDAAVGSTTDVSTRVLVLENGFFGLRLEEIARSYSPNVERLSFPIGQPVSVDKVDRLLRREAFDALLVVHCETSVGIVNPVEELGRIARSHGVTFLVDAISSLGIEPFEMDAWGVNLCVSASQKGLEAPAGLGIVAVDKNTWEKIGERKTPGWYLNLATWKRYEEEWGAWHPHPVTHAVNNVRALRAAIDRVLTEGMEARATRHREVATMLRTRLRSLGFAPFVDDLDASHGVTSVLGPKGRVNALIEDLAERHNLLIAGSPGSLHGKVFRIGHMGPMATPEAVEMVVAALESASEGFSTKGGPIHE